MKVAEGLDAALRARLPDGSPANLVHGSLAARDVLVSWGGLVKLKGLGMWQAVLGASMQRPTNGLARLEGTAPEIARGQAPDARSDVFALGMLLRRMLLGQRFSPHTSPAEAIRLVYEGVVHGSLHEQSLLGPMRQILRRATAPNPRDRYADAGELARDLRRIATLMGIPDVPAFIARSVEEAFAPEISRREAQREREAPPAVIEAFAEVIDVNGHELFTYGDVVEVSPLLLSPPLNDTLTMPSIQRAVLALLPPDEPSEPAPLTPRVEELDLAFAAALAASTIETPAAFSTPKGLAVMPNAPPRPQLRPLRPRQQSGVDFRGADLDSAPTIVSASPWFDDV